MEQKQTALTNEAPAKSSASQAARQTLSQESPRYYSPLELLERMHATAGNHATGCWLQAKLKVGAPTDVYEQEADRVADQIVNAPSNHAGASQPVKSSVPSNDNHIRRQPAAGNSRNADLEDENTSATPQSQESGSKVFLTKPDDDETLQRKCDCEEDEHDLQLKTLPSWSEAADSPKDTVQRKCACGRDMGASENECAECKADHEGQLQRVANSPARVDGAPSVVNDVLGSPGQTLTLATRAFFEPHFGHDFGSVRVHTDAQAARSAEALGALAYTVGSRIAFASGMYNPDSLQGRKLLAHELVHVVQQGYGPRTAPPSGSSLSGSSVSLRRHPDPKSPAELQDPISESDLPGFGFWAVGPEYSGVPSEADVRQVLGERGVADAKTLNECIAQIFQLKGGDPKYFAYVHRTLGVVARAYGGLFGYSEPNGKKKEEIYSVFAYVSDKDSTKYRPVGGTGVRRAPTPVLGQMSRRTGGSFADLYANLRLIEARLATLAKRYADSSPQIGASTAVAQTYLEAFRSKLVGSSEQAQTIETALQLLEWVDFDLNLVTQQRAKLISSSVPVTSVDEVIKLYSFVLQQLLQPSAMARYDEAQRYSERLPIDIMLDALRAHGSINAPYLKPSATLVDWVDDVRLRVDRLYEKRQQLAVRPGNVSLTKEIEDEAAFLEAAVRGVQFYGEWLVTFEQFLKNKPGVLDTPLVDAMNRLVARVQAMKAAYDTNDTKLLKQRVDALEGDPGVKTFLHALPAAMGVTRLVGKIGVTTLAAIATGGVGGLLAGGTRAAATGITLRGALTFAGTAVLEAATFTVINATASKLLFDEKVTFGSLLKDFAWNLGLFSVLRGISGASGAMLRAAELEVLSAPVQLTVGFPAANAWGVLRFRIEQGRWPTQAELDQMTAESMLLLAGVALGSKGVQRWLEARKTASSLTLFYREYGWRFEALETLRTELGERVKRAEAAGKGNDQSELNAAKSEAEALEKRFQELLRDILKDKRFHVAQIRSELNAMRESAPNVAAELLENALGVPLEVAVLRAGPASYTYANGKTSVLEEALAKNYTVTKSADAKTSLKVIKATSPNAPDLLFQERSSGALDFDPGLYDVQKLMLDFSLTSSEAQKMLWRILSENGIARDARQATIVTRRQVRDLTQKEGKSADEVLRDLYKVGRLRGTSPKALVEIADRLAGKGILKSEEWLDAREDVGRRGIVGEWLAEEAVSPAAGGRVFRSVTAQGDLFEDAAGTTPAKDREGRARTNVSVAETDLVSARDVSGAYEVDTILNVKTAAGKAMVESAVLQNDNFLAILKSAPGDLVKLQLSEGIRYARIKSISAFDGTATVTLTGKLKPAGAVGTETIGPKGARGFTKQLLQQTKEISTIAALLAEMQLIGSGEY